MIKIGKLYEYHSYKKKKKIKEIILVVKDYFNGSEGVDIVDVIVVQGEGSFLRTRMLVVQQYLFELR